MDLSTTYRTLSLSISIGAALSLASCSDSAETRVTGADPGVLEAPIAFVRRPIPANTRQQQSDLREPLYFAAGGDVYMRSNSTVTASEINISARVTQGQGDVKDLRPSFDGKKLLFSLRLDDPNPNDDEIPSWNIFEYELEKDALRCVLDSDRETLPCDGLNAGQGDDLGPAYLADGRIVFSSNRQRQSGEMLTNEGRPRFRALDEDRDTLAMALHVMNDDGGDLHQISFNPSHDLDPMVLTRGYSGELVFTRWDNAAGNSAMHLYKINPDGSQLQPFYGAHSHASGASHDGTNDATIQFSQPEEMEDGRIMVIARPFSGTFGGGDIVIIDGASYVDNQQPVTSMAGIPGNAQASATINNISTANEISRGGRYSAAYPLWDGSQRILVSKSSCELDINGLRRPCTDGNVAHPDAEEAAPAYGIWLYDMQNHTEKVLVTAQPGIILSDIVALQSRPQPGSSPAATLDLNWVDEGLAALHIRSVYDFGGADFDSCFLSDCSDATAIATVKDLGNPANATADQRPARFLRFTKPVALPDEDDRDLGDDAPDLDRAAFGPLINLGMREILGYAPVEPDGSVKVKLPANIPLAISVLDRQGRRIGPRHNNWFQLRPGETMECTGCHNHSSAGNATPTIHHRRDAERPSINSGIGASTVFENTLNPDTGDTYFGNMGDSMAEVRFRLAANEPELSADVIYSDYWTDPAAALRPADTDFSYSYTDLATPSPASCSPANDWNFTCRIVINYEQHIHPLWSIARGVAGANSCTNCHSDFDNTLMLERVPAAQLDLGDGDSDQEPERFTSYRELFFVDQQQELDAGGQLVNIQIAQLVPIVDGNGDPVLDLNGDPTFNTIFIDDPNARTRTSMSANGARASHFIEKMTETELNASRSLLPATDSAYVDHSSFLTAHELRLIAEWLDIGAQYFNNPFDPDVPVN